MPWRFVVERAAPDGHNKTAIALVIPSELHGASLLHAETAMKPQR